MGMYTGLMVSVTIKPEYRQAIAHLHEVQQWAMLPPGSLPGMKLWQDVRRCNFIPWGALCYMPEDFGNRPAGIEDSFSEFDPETGLWRFACSLKNYESEIEEFMNFLISLISHVDYAWSLYEEHGDDNWRDHVIKHFPDDMIMS